MSIRFEKDRAVFDNICDMAEAEDFLQWLAENPSPSVDLAGCKHMHTSLLQIILSFKPTILSIPKEKAAAVWFKNIKK